ncbi:MAG: hypothetical protein M1828_000757 [Chrysothrix sp. TS-e1954]|nr:MAG: hypothetical protein M1828_000757 [Chrysothrix sp. TS-e1954]
MDIYATPARRGDFVYLGELLVDPGNAKQYRRASDSQLQALLRPQASAPVKDETAHFYEAQLIHYGLQRTKDKARAKWRLHEALNAEGLQVPAEVKRLETALNKEYAANVKRSKESASPAIENGAHGKGRKHDNDTATASTPTPPKKKQKASDRSVAQSRPPASVRSTKMTTKASGAVSKQWQSNPNLNGVIKREPSDPPRERSMITNSFNWPAGSAPIHPYVVKHGSIPTAKSNRGSWQAASSRPTSSVALSAPPTPQNTVVQRGGLQTARSVRGSHQSTLDRSAFSLLTPSLGSGLQQTTPGRNGSTAESTQYQLMPKSEEMRRSPLLSVSGQWTVHCPMIDSEFGAICSMRLLLVQATAEHPTGYAWGDYNFGAFEGALRAEPQEWIDGALRFEFEWRGHNTVTGEIMFEADRVGEFTIYRDNSLGGCFENMYGESLDFFAKREPGAKRVCGRQASDFQDEWDQYNESSYER